MVSYFHRFCATYSKPSYLVGHARFVAMEPNRPAIIAVTEPLETVPAITTLFPNGEGQTRLQVHASAWLAMYATKSAKMRQQWPASVVEDVQLNRPQKCQAQLIPLSLNKGLRAVGRTGRPRAPCILPILMRRHRIPRLTLETRRLRRNLHLRWSHRI